VAGRFFSKARGADVLLDTPHPSADLQPSIVLNESAVRFLDLARPGAAVGKSVVWERFTTATSPTDLPSEVIGVVPDFSLGSMRTAVNPTIFYVDPQRSGLLVLKLDRRRIPEALGGLRQIWRRTGHDGQPNIVFETQAIQTLYLDVITQGIAIGICAGMAIFIACIGLFALAAFTTEQRTKEIGVRKALGASTLDVVKLLLWQFTLPVLWANLIAWPASWWAMDWWLRGFAYHVDLPVWLFGAATGAAVVIAWATVSTHAWLVARSKPVTALRYE
jgi:putative ABC transport system permease protein